MPRTFNLVRTTPPKGRYARILACIRGQYRKTWLCPDTPRLDGRLAFVTGGTGGIGAEIVKGLARRGAEVIAAARGNASSEAACAAWSNETGSKIRFLRLDLSDLASVRAAVEVFERDWPGRRVDVFCANAGVSPHAHSLSADGHEFAFAVNCLGHHALLKGLLNKDRLADRARIVGATGDIYVLARDCTSDFTYSGRGLQAYCRSKLGNLWQYGELARRHADLTVVSVHPGVVATGLEGPQTGVGGWVKRQMLLPPSLGAQSSLIAATQEAVETGAYFHNVHGLMDLRSDDPALNLEKSAEFWSTLERLAA
ncbi:MAG: SDR family NAD(P)-dependent oxidoreductase [Pseudomonadota bacterium]